jgi:hypothetical protein
VTPLAQSILLVLIWGFIATLVMTSVLFISQNVGWSRLNMPVLLGSFFSPHRREANVLGYLMYMLGGELFAFVYYLIFSVIGGSSGWIGGLAGMIHGILLLALALPMLPYIHPRVASLYEAPDSDKTLEPPGFLGLHYGYLTPLTVMVAQTAYGVLLGIGFGSLFQGAVHAS